LIIFENKNIMIAFPQLENDWLRLEQLSASHTLELWEVVKHLDIYKYGPNDLSSKELLKAYIKEANVQFDRQTAIPFAVFDKKSKKYVGCTRFGFIDQKNKTLHIGWTWIALESQGTGLNKSMKNLLLSEAFGPMKMRKVIFRIDALNTRSRRAVEKLGAQLEGVLKKDIYVKENRLRDSCCYAIFKEDFELSAI
jgi:RimJ/RimL family protein N-acetyltransferase